jgi:hypothetical protein
MASQQRHRPGWCRDKAEGKVMAGVKCDAVRPRGLDLRDPLHTPTGRHTWVTLHRMSASRCVVVPTADQARAAWICAAPHARESRASGHATQVQDAVLGAPPPTPPTIQMYRSDGRGFRVEGLRGCWAMRWRAVEREAPALPRSLVL